MHLFVVYAVTVWYVAFRWRRKLGGIAVIAAAMVGLHFFNLIHGDFAAMFAYDERIFRGLMYPYMVLVAAVGLYLFSFPRELPRGRVHCRACWFDLSDHEDLDDDTPCPECGTTPAEARSRKGRRTARRRLARPQPLAEVPGIAITPDDWSAADDAHGYPDQQHADR